jgi:lipopolysaccharide assembly outer membrane protein LptD (OstA)
VDAPNIRALPSNGPASGELTYVLGRYLRGRGDSNIQTIILTYDIKTDVYTAIGNVKAVEGTTTLTGDVISLHNRSHIHAIGHVHLIDLDSNIVASEGTLDLATEEATLYHAKVYAFDRSYYLTGTKIQKTLGQHYRAENALLTTCTCDMRSATKSDRGCMFPSAGFASCRRRRM